MTRQPWIASLALLALLGCDGLLEETPESFLAPENFYRTAADIDAALFAAYQPLVTGENAFGKNLWVTLDGGSDEAISNPVVPSAVVQAFGRMDYTADQGRINSFWPELYRTITRANIVIERAPGVQATADRKAQLVAEAKFLRAFSYFYLVRLFGDVPLVTSVEDAAREDMARTPKEEVYKLILQDAQAAAQGLPAKWDAANVGRATQGAALTLLANVHLTRQEWQQAATNAKRVIDLGIYRLNPDYLKAFSPAARNGPEDVFSLQTRDEPGAAGARWVDMYYPREVGAGRCGGWAWIVPNPWQVASYAPGDYRREVTYETNFLNCTTNRVVTVDKPHVHKFRPSNLVNITAGDTNIPIFRYAEVLLIYAEALNELGQSAEAVTYLNMVRERARNANGTRRTEPAAYSGPTGRDAVREAIFQERRWELAHEAKRWFDLVRRGEAYFMAQLRANDPQAVPTPHKMLLPIPQGELERNTALVQNPGY